jgi:hypothetical protein
MDGQSWTITWGAGVRQFFRDLFGSRLVERLELDLVNLRNDFEQRLQDQALLVATLREEKQLLMSKVTMYEMTIMPHSSRAGAEVVAYQKPTKPLFSYAEIPAPKSRWQVVQDQHEEQMRKEIEEEKAAAAAKG